MTVLWLCNTVIPKIAEELSWDADAYGGWLAGASDMLSEHCSLTICFPVAKGNEVSGRAGPISFYGFCRRGVFSSLAAYIRNLRMKFRDILYGVKPDIVHIWGTEYPHSYAMAAACIDAGMIDRTVISIQGLVSVCARHYFSGLPASAVYGFSLRDLIKRDNVFLQKRKFERAGLLERKAIGAVKHIIGRTDWDEACSGQINPGARYHFCNETLRKFFYENRWSLDGCERHSIFVSQGNYPIKGLHFVIEAMPLILRRYADAHLYVAGKNIVKYDTARDKIKITGYGLYIRRLIQKHGLWGRVTFTGVLDERGMCEQYLKSHVFVSASSIENSPNSLGEAMLLGVPSVTSDVGGVKNLMRHGEEGFVYQADAPYMLAHYVCKIFGDDELASRMSENARRHAAATHDRERNLARLLGIYREIARQEHE